MEGICLVTEDGGVALDTEAEIQGKEATDATAETHVAHIKSTLQKHHGKSVKHNALCLTGDNTNTNPKIAKLLQKTLIGCRSHRHNLEMERFINQQPIANKRVLQTAHKSQIKATESANMMAKLRNLTKSKPKIMNETRWRGKFLCINQFSKLASEGHGPN